jgi:hypothetical protein
MRFFALFVSCLVVAASASRASADAEVEKVDVTRNVSCPTLSPAMKQAIRASIAVAGAAGFARFGAHNLNIADILSGKTKFAEVLASLLIAEICFEISGAQLVNMVYKPDPISKSTMQNNLKTKGLKAFLLSLVPLSVFSIPWLAAKMQFHRRLSNYLLGDKFFDPEGEAEMKKSAEASSKAE